ncbi:hypothetical protein Ga0609869_001885 [Rhodovulum iodosum]|uniref:Hedgehog/Intein (Hint) domain-containing protein n=1 Tax=Rhodovulum iodosum TaxID=68291 RepID=A0ABV3XVX7_9RHOB|nr:Hint domain-containing protein [Rhodovulum robiginosum]RSK32002.1 Hint domain-containing protein [Rhodovulum robiginosum]
MGYNISEVSGAEGGGTLNLDTWTFTLDLGVGATTISGDFDQVPLGGGASSEATDGYSFSALNQQGLGTLTTNSSDGTFTFIVDRAAVLATGSDQTLSFTVTGSSGGNSDQDTVVINILICVARGTLIETVEGAVPVETLRQGDPVRTYDGGSAPIRWIGSRRVNASELTAHPELRPVRIAAGALGSGRPYRDLVVSPQHRVLLQDWRAELLFGEAEVLVPAKSLLDDDKVRVDHLAEEVEYFHLLFDRHEIMFTEGAPTESFHPGPYAMRELAAPARAELVRLFPELSGGVAPWAAARPALKAWEGKLLGHGRPGAGAAGAGEEQRWAS